MTKDNNLLKQIEEARESLSSLRRRRRRCIDFACGRQWGDTVRTGDGRVMSEGTWMRRRGRTPVTNNLIRRTINGIVGYWVQQSGRSNTDPLIEVDAHTLEQLLVSGMAIQRMGNHSDMLLSGVRNISSEHFFCNRDTDSAPTLVGATYRFTAAQVAEAFCNGDPALAMQIAEVLNASPSQQVTVYEVWQRQEQPMLYWHDPQHGLQCYTTCTATHLQDIDRLSARRTDMGRPALHRRFVVARRWQQTWLTTHGEILHRQTYDTQDALPYIMVFMPSPDGEIHIPVEELIEQQKQINMLVSTLDSVIDHSAKGILLYPSDQLPRGLTWKDIRRMWDSPGSILPFAPTRKHLTPTQVNTSGRLDGAMQMLQLQMKLFDDIAGVDSAVSGTRGHATGSEMLKTGIEQSHIVLRDLLTTFNDLLLRRNARLQNAECRMQNAKKCLKSTTFEGVSKRKF